MENTNTKEVEPRIEPNDCEETYFSMGSNETGFLEIDLISFRQKNHESKYLSLAVSSPAEEGGVSEPNIFAIDNEEAFLKLKNFFIQLKWNI